MTSDLFDPDVTVLTIRMTAAAVYIDRGHRAQLVLGGNATPTLAGREHGSIPPLAISFSYVGPMTQAQS